MTGADRLVVAVVGASVGVLVAGALRLFGELPAGSTAAGVVPAVALGALATRLAIGARARGAWAVATMAPGVVASAWCVAARLAGAGSMTFVRYAGLWTRGTDDAWLLRFTGIGAAAGLACGALLAAIMRARAASAERPTLDAVERTLAWTFGAAATSSAVAAPFLGRSAGALAAAAALGLAAVAARDVARARWLRAAWASGNAALGPVVHGVLPVTGASVHAGLYDGAPGRPYRGAEATPITLVAATVGATARPLLVRAGTCAALSAGALAVAAWALR